ncbi:MAG: acyltransferase family protein [Bacteroidales bacterium]
MNLKYYKNLDGLRGIASLMVLVFHFFITPNSSYLTNRSVYQSLTLFGQHGVSLFFVLSGFVITRILINSKEDENYFVRFYWKRALRILPLYYIFLFAFYFALDLLKWSNISHQLPYLLYYQNFDTIFNFVALGPSHYWSLAIEEHFYLIWPLVVYFVPTRNLLKVIFILFVAVFLVKYVMLFHGIGISKFTFARIDQLLFGAILSIMELKNMFKNDKTRIYLFLILIGTLLINAILFLQANNYPFWTELLKYTTLGLLFFTFLGWLITLNGDHPLNVLLSSKVLQYLGKISYGIYIWHILVLFILNKYFLTKNLILDFSLSIALSILVAHISFYYYERQFLKLKNKYA